MHREGRGLSPWQLLSSWQPGHHSGPLASWHGCVSPLFSWWTLGPVCPWRTWACPKCSACMRQSLILLRSCPLGTWCARWVIHGSGCASACSCSWSLCGPCWGPWPWGSTEPWLCSLMAAEAESSYVLTFRLHATFWIISFYFPFSILIFSTVIPSCLTLLLF